MTEFRDAFILNKFKFLFIHTQVVCSIPGKGCVGGS